MGLSPLEVSAASPCGSRERAACRFASPPLPKEAEGARVLLGETPLWLRFTAVGRDHLRTPPSWCANRPEAGSQPEHQNGVSWSVELASFVTPGLRLGWNEPASVRPFAKSSQAAGRQPVPHGNRSSLVPDAETSGVATTHDAKYR